MRPNKSKSLSERLRKRLGKKIRLRKKISGTLERPRLCIYKSLSHMYAQVIDDINGKVLCAASSLGSEAGARGTLAEQVGNQIAILAKTKGVSQVVFDRNGFKYHGVVKKLADAARAGGLAF